MAPTELAVPGGGPGAGALPLSARPSDHRGGRPLPGPGPRRVRPRRPGRGRGSGRRRRPPTVLVLDPTWKSGDSLAVRAVTRAGVRFIDGAHVTYAVLSTFEVGSFPMTWGVAPDGVTFIPWHFDLADDELAQPVSVEGGFVAGGDSLRDYPTLLRAAPAVPAPVTIATRGMPKNVPTPPNVSVGPVERSRYDELLRGATAVVLPLQVRRDRSSGQGTLLNAMAHGKT